MGDHAHGGGGKEIRTDPRQHSHQARHHLQGGRRRPQEGEGRRVQVYEQRGDPRGAGQQPQTDTKMASDNEQKLDELSRKLGVQEEELRRAVERAELAENKVKSIEEELQLVGENMKQLELSAEKAVEREEKLKDKILNLNQKYKAAEGRFEYGEMNITKLNQRVDDIEDEIYREKLKIKRCADELGETFDDMLENY